MVPMAVEVRTGAGRSGQTLVMAEIRLADRSTLPGAAAALAAAFVDDPVWCWLVGRDSLPAAAARRFFRADAAARQRHGGEVYVADGDGSAAVWASPARHDVTWFDLARQTPIVMRLFGRNTPRAINMLVALDKVHPTEPHWYLAFLGTRPERQGRGLGSAVMAPVLDRCDAEGVPAYLESSKESNVPFYRRHGFEVTSVFESPGDGPPLWCMWRDPQPP